MPTYGKMLNTGKRGSIEAFKRNLSASCFFLILRFKGKSHDFALNLATCT